MFTEEIQNHGFTLISSRPGEWIQLTEEWKAFIRARLEKQV